MSEKEFSDESDYEGKPIDEVIRDAIAWEKSANEWRKVVYKLESENERIRKALELAKEQRDENLRMAWDNRDMEDDIIEATMEDDAAINELLNG